MLGKKNAEIFILLFFSFLCISLFCWQYCAGLFFTTYEKPEKLKNRFISARLTWDFFFFFDCAFTTAVLFFREKNKIKIAG